MIFRPRTLRVGAIGPVHENVVPNLMDRMEKWGAYDFVFRAIEALGKFGPKAASAPE